MSDYDKGIGSKAQTLEEKKNKPRYELLPFKALDAVARVMTIGAKIRTGEHGWREGIQYSRLIGKTLRHISEFSRGVDLDVGPDGSQESVIANAICDLLMLLEFIEEKRTELDDRYKKEKI